MSSVSRYYKYLIEDWKPYRTDMVSHLYLVKRDENNYELKIQKFSNSIVSNYLISNKEFIPELSTEDIETLNKFFRKEIIRDYLL